jgi:hypothetical protein
MRLLRLSITLTLLLASARTIAFQEWSASMPLWQLVHPVVAEAGHPACDPNQPHRAPCEMKSCAQIGPDGKANGHKCSSYCAKRCCGCGTACTVDYPGEGPNPDEGNQ